MTDLAKRRRARKKKQNEQDFLPKGILDVIETDYPDRYVMLSEDYASLEKLFSAEEWLDILTKVRNSYESNRRLVSPRLQDLP